MNPINKVELKLKDYEKCHMLVDSDCALGVLFDYAAALQVFVIEKMKESQKVLEAEKNKISPKVETLDQ